MNSGKLDELEKKSKAAAESNSERTSRIDNSISSLKEASAQLERLELDLGNSPPVSVKIDLDKLRSDFEAKRSEISKLIDSVKSFELNNTSKDEQIEKLQSAVDKRDDMLNTCKSEIFEYKKAIAKLESHNLSLKQGLMEKESMLHIMKSRFIDRSKQIKELIDVNIRLKDDLENNAKVLSSLMSEVEALKADHSRENQKNLPQKYELVSSELEKSKRTIEELTIHIDEIEERLKKSTQQNQKLVSGLADSKAAHSDVLTKHTESSKELESARKALLASRNRVDALELRLHNLNEQNQKIMYQLLDSKKRLAQSESVLSAKESEFKSALESKEEELAEHRNSAAKKRSLIMEHQARKITVLHSQIAALNAKLKRQNEFISDKLAKEKELMRVFGRQIKELVSASGTDLNFGVSMPSNSKDEFQESEGISNISEDLQDIKSPMFSFDFADDSAEDDAAFSTNKNLPDRVGELVALIENAIDNGDSKEKIKNSLNNSGYSPSEIDKAFSRV